jgi:hypothetical protein
MKVKTQDLVGPALDWAVAKCEKKKVARVPIPGWNNYVAEVKAIKTFPWGPPTYSPSTDWSQGGRIAERELIRLTPCGHALWEAEHGNNLVGEWGTGVTQFGPTPLIAAMRCYVAVKLGEEIDIPEELLT